jgi:hypothetical protein
VAFALPLSISGGSRAFSHPDWLEDPNDRLSHESLFIQLADWNAYAALRSNYLAPKVASFATAWDNLSPCLVQVETLTKPPHRRARDPERRGKPRRFPRAIILNCYPLSGLSGR